jgi:hypothetical protein
MERPGAVCRTGMRSRLKFDIRFDLAGGKWFSNANWAVCGQCHGYLPTGSPPLGFEIHGDRIRLRIMPTITSSATALAMTPRRACSGSAVSRPQQRVADVRDHHSVRPGCKRELGRVQAERRSGTPAHFHQDAALRHPGPGLQHRHSGINTTDGSWACVGDASPGYWKLGLYQNATIAERIVEYKDMEFEAWTPVY